jgi:hypothetical protein
MLVHISFLLEDRTRPDQVPLQRVHRMVIF